VKHSRQLQSQLQRLFPGGSAIFQRMYTRLGCEGRPPQFLVEYHPYTDLTHTIRLREDTAHVRLSDAMSRAPLAAVEAAAALLLGRLYRRRVPEELLNVYREFSYAAGTRRTLLAQRRRRARRVLHLPAGANHDLSPLYEELNRQYFEGALARPELGWSARAWSTQLGCFDPALNQIVINCKLDADDVPGYAVAYVLYHEMLHQKHPVRFARCRRESHSAQFRAEERRFADYERAMGFLKRLR
jgi:hypothetical protein